MKKSKKIKKNDATYVRLSDDLDKWLEGLCEKRRDCKSSVIRNILYKFKESKMTL